MNLPLFLGPLVLIFSLSYVVSTLLPVYAAPLFQNRNHVPKGADEPELFDGNRCSKAFTLLQVGFMNRQDVTFFNPNNLDICTSNSPDLL